MLYRIILNLDKIDNLELMVEKIDQWCMSNFGDKKVGWNIHGSYGYDFFNQESMALFLLRWSDIIGYTRQIQL